MSEVEEIASSFNLFMPGLMTHRLKVYVWIKDFTIKVGSVTRKFLVPISRFNLTVATAEENATKIQGCVTDWVRFKDRHLRYLNVLYYFRHAKKLRGHQPSPDSMIAEVVLNLAKCIEILFACSTDRDALRGRARQWKFTEHEIETFLIPLFLLRNELDVAHVAGGPLTNDELAMVVEFMDAAIEYVESLLHRIFNEVLAGQIVLDSLPPSLSQEKANLLHRIRSQLDRYKESAR